MTSPEPGSTTSAMTSRKWASLVRMMIPPFRSPQFWLLQIMVFVIAATHDLLLAWLGHQDGPLAIPEPVTSALFFVPVLYAALFFGVQGAVGTALLSTVLVIPHWFTADSLTSVHVWIESGNLLVLNVIAVVVGRRVERERLARVHAERALTVAESATTRYQALFGTHPSPVVIADAAGSIVESNAAAAQLFGDTKGQDLQTLLGVALADLLEQSSRLRLPTQEGEERLFLPNAQAISVGSGVELIQVCLVDITEQQRRQDEQRRFSLRLLEVQEEERRRLTEELHDDPLQTLMFLSRELEDVATQPDLPPGLAERIHRDAVLVTDAGTVLRRVIHGLRPPVLDDLGLVSALRQLTTEAAGRPEAPTIQLHISGRPQRLAAQTELTAYRVVQESLSNVLRHADAGRADVRVAFKHDLTITVADNGRGIQTDAVREENRQLQGFGLLGMRERVAAVGGHIEVRPRSPQGTLIRVTMPV